MANINDVEANEFITKVAEELKKSKEITPPEWSDYVKTGVQKEKPPVDKDWWYVRLAAVLRTVALMGPIGVSKLRTKYGGQKNRGHKPNKFMKGSGSVIRKALQQLESLNYVKQEVVDGHKGRVITKEGKEFLNSVAQTLTKAPSKSSSTKEEKETKKEPKKERSKEVKKTSKEETKAPVEKGSSEEKEDKKKEAAKETPKDNKDEKKASEESEEKKE